MRFQTAWHMLRGLILDANDLRKSGCSVDHGESKKLDCSFEDVNFPWTNKVHSYFFP
jgi:hypothetical protein